MSQPIDKEEKAFNFKQYAPLGIITLFSFILSASLMKNEDELLYRFMGFFLSIFSLFKWIDIKGFTQAFKEYDLISKYIPSYLIIYPIIELTLGLLYISISLTILANIVTILFMSSSAVSVIKALLEKRKLTCACLGTTLKLPLTYVSLFEIIFMILMAFSMLY